MINVKRLVLIRGSIAALLAATVLWDIHRYASADLLRWVGRAVFLVVAAAQLWRAIALPWRVRSLRKRTAGEIVKIRQKFFGDEIHDYRVTSLDHFPHVDRAFYDMTRTWFETNGFRFIADLDNATVNQHVRPINRAPIRMFLSPDGSISGACFHVLLVTVRPDQFRSVRRIEFETEFSDGTFLSTRNGHDPRILPYPGIEENRMDPNASPQEMRERHRQSIAHKLTTNPALSAIRYRDLEDMIQAAHRIQTLKIRHRQTRDWGTDRKKIVGRELNQREKEIAEEIRRLEGREPT